MCQANNRKVERERPELCPVPVKSPWYHLGMDFVGPISPPSRSGNRYVLTVSDYFTKFAWAKALPTKEAVNVAQALREVNSFGVVKPVARKRNLAFQGYFCMLSFYVYDCSAKKG